MSWPLPLRGAKRRPRRSAGKPRRARTPVATGSIVPKPHEWRWRHLLAEGLEDRRVLSVLTYSTYWGGSRNEAVADVAADSDGNTYLLGTTESPDLGDDSG